MCDKCKTVAPGYMFQHELSRCPFAAGLLCTWCATYGHTSDTCPSPPSKRYTEPAFLEQLVPFSMLLEHNITTRTPLPIQSTPMTPTTTTTTDGVIEIEDDNTVIRQFLRNKGLSCPRADTKGATTKIRNILFNYAKQQNKRVVYGFLPSATVEHATTS